MSATRDLGVLVAADFEPHVGTAFRLEVDEGTLLELDLIEVTGGAGDEDRDAHRLPFSLIFRGPKGTVCEQQICPLEHSEMGAIDLFLVPIGPDDEGMRYEAVFG